jgi:hypothetical protein
MRLHQGRTRVAALTALLGATAALGFAGPASASVTCQTPGYSSGGALQSIAQFEVWLTSSGWDTHSSCSTAPTSSSMTYNHTSSGQALEEFGNNTGELNAHEDKLAFESATGTKDAAGQVLDWYVGTDDPPTTAQLENAQTAAGASALTEMTIPVAQAPVAVLLSLPTGCKVQTGSQVDLNNASRTRLRAAHSAPVRVTVPRIRSCGRRFRTTGRVRKVRHMRIRWNRRALSPTARAQN